jgi:hypothetical protein
VGLAPTGKRRLVTAHTQSGHSSSHCCAPSSRGSLSDVSRPVGFGGSGRSVTVLRRLRALRFARHSSNISPVLPGRFDPLQAGTIFSLVSNPSRRKGGPGATCPPEALSGPPAPAMAYACCGRTVPPSTLDDAEVLSLLRDYNTTGQGAAAMTGKGEIGRAQIKRRWPHRVELQPRRCAALRTARRPSASPRRSARRPIRFQPFTTIGSLQCSTSAPPRLRKAVHARFGGELLPVVEDDPERRRRH